MSKFTNLLATSHELAIAAVEEASRFGVRTVDVEHVLLALTITERPAGHVLRGMGITLDHARDAVTELHNDQLASLGIDAELPGDGTIRFHEHGGYDYTDRAMRVMSQSSSWDRVGDSLEMLRELVTEPSGTIEALLSHLGTDPRTVIERIDTAQDEPGGDDASSQQPMRGSTRPADYAGPQAGSAARRTRFSRQRTVYIPADPGEVWALVSNPERLPEWELNLESVRGDDTGWTGRTRTIAPDGKKLKVRATALHQEIEAVAMEEPHVAWRFRFPDRPRANTRLIEVDVASAPGGANATVSFAWERGTAPRGILRLVAPITRFVMRPFVRFAMWIQLHALTSAISRALR